MSLCTRCGASFACAMADNTDTTGSACWCTTLPAAVPVPLPAEATGCWCRACLEAHIAELSRPNVDAQNPLPIK
ncbi:MAG: cysteine-rich CWC family protein [Pseudomonadota bacterium]|nr:cysteine-rich CWC family protein [Pseudomonadota bacterium]